MIYLYTGSFSSKWKKKMTFSDFFLLPSHLISRSREGENRITRIHSQQRFNKSLQVCSNNTWRKTVGNFFASPLPPPSYFPPIFALSTFTGPKLLNKLVRVIVRILSCWSFSFRAPKKREIGTEGRMGPISNDRLVINPANKLRFDPCWRRMTNYLSLIATFAPTILLPIIWKASSTRKICNNHENSYPSSCRHPSAVFVHYLHHDYLKGLEDDDVVLNCLHRVKYFFHIKKFHAALVNLPLHSQFKASPWSFCVRQINFTLIPNIFEKKKCY